MLGSRGLVAAAGLLGDDLDALLGGEDTDSLVVNETSVLRSMMLAPNSPLESESEPLLSYLARVNVRRVVGVARELNTTATSNVLATLHEEGVVVACMSTSKSAIVRGLLLSAFPVSRGNSRTTSQTISDETLVKDILSYVTSYVGNRGTRDWRSGWKFEIDKTNYHHTKLNSQTVCPPRSGPLA